MEHCDDAPLADETQPSAIPNDQPAGDLSDRGDRKDPEEVVGDDDNEEQR
jgi:hypothetical protein